MRQYAHLFKALSDETRLRILALLQVQELCVCDLMSVLQNPQSTISRHLAVLRQAGLVLDRRQGVWMYYSITKSADLFLQSVLRSMTVAAACPLAQSDRNRLKDLQTVGQSTRCQDQSGE